MFSYNGLPLIEHPCSRGEKIHISALCKAFLELALLSKGKYLSLAFVWVSFMKGRGKGLWKERPGACHMGITDGRLCVCNWLPSHSVGQGVTLVESI